jgi:hypothetical protein
MVIGMLGVCLTVLSIILAYIWKGNQKMEKAILDGQERLEEGLKILEEGQKEIAKIVKEGQIELAQMLLNQTRILERIEGKIPAPSG